MTKLSLNQNAKFVQKLRDTIETNFDFSNKPLNRLKIIKNNIHDNDQSKVERLLELKKRIDTIVNCNLKSNSKKLIMGDGNINSDIMMIGESPGSLETNSGLTFQGDVGILLNKMLSAIDIKREKIYLAYSINFRPPDDRKPTSQEINRYSAFLKEHISIIDPKILVLLGTTSMRSVTGLNSNISSERGQWKEIILKNKSYPFIVTFSPSYLIRYPNNKKYSWSDLKKIKQKIKDSNIKI